VFHASIRFHFDNTKVSNLLKKWSQSYQQYVDNNNKILIINYLILWTTFPHRGEKMWKSF